MFIRLVPRTLRIVLLLVSLCLSSCSSLITTTVIEPAVGNLQQQTNIDLVCEGAPAFLLMIDSMLVSSPKNQGLLLAGTQSYCGYAAALEECGESDKKQAETRRCWQVPDIERCFAVFGHTHCTAPGISVGLT